MCSKSTKETKTTAILAFVYSASNFKCTHTHTLQIQVYVSEMHVKYPVTQIIIHTVSWLFYCLLTPEGWKDNGKRNEKQWIYNSRFPRALMLTMIWNSQISENFDTAITYWYIIIKLLRNVNKSLSNCSEDERMWHLTIFNFTNQIFQIPIKI